MTTKGSSTIHFTMQVDKDICEAFAALCDAMNISMSAGISSLMQRAVRNRELGLELDEKGFTQEEVKELLLRIQDVECGRLESHALLEE